MQTQNPEPKIPNVPQSSRIAAGGTATIREDCGTGNNRSHTSRAWLGVAALALAFSGMVQNHVEARRIAANLTWSDPEKNALEVGFLALGGFRGLLADILWVRAIRHQETGRYYELKLLCDMILKLQPTFTQIHAYQAYTMCFSLARRAETPAGKWYWIRSGLITLEKGLERNYRNYSLWFELAYMYVDRFGDAKRTDFGYLHRRQLPNIYDLTDEERRAVFLKEDERRERWAREGVQPRPPLPTEHLRYAAYYLWQAMATNTDPTPVRTERLYGDCVQNQGHFWSNPRKPAAERGWDDWGAEDWWLEMRRRNEARGLSLERTIGDNLKGCMFQQMDYFARSAEAARQAGKTAEAAALDKKAQAARDRYASYFPNDNKPLAELLQRYHDFIARQIKAQLQAPLVEPVAP
ncbi:MAG: hypothetical protein ABSE73_08730 [Planctomycetota bacterium]